MIDHVLRTATALNPTSTTLVVGHGADEVRRHLRSHSHLQFVVQTPQLGTGHAVLQTAPLLRGQQGTVLLLSGDVPLLTSRALEGLLATHHAANAVATVLTAVIERPYGYGRIVRSHGVIARIVEERDASPAQREIKEINSGIYAFAATPLFDALEQIGPDNAQGEYYLPDLIAIYRKRRKVVTTYTIENASEIRGINSRSELAEVSAMVRQQKNEELMAAGVTLIDPATTYIDEDVEIASDTVIHPCVFIEGSTKIGIACEIHAGSRIVNSEIGDRVVIRNHSVLTEARVATGAHVGPFAHLRPAADVGADAHVGNFVELKKTTLGAAQQSESSRLPWRRHHRSRRQRRRRHDHVQLRRRAPNTPRSSRTVPLSGAIRRWSRPSQSARAPTSVPGRPSPTMSPPGRSRSAAGARRTKRDG